MALSLPANFDWELGDYLRALSLNKWLILLVTIVFWGAGTIHMNRQPNVYEATARVLIESQRPQPLEFQSTISTIDAYDPAFLLRTEYQIVTSPPVMERVVKDLNLNAVPLFSEAEDPAEMLKGMIKIEPVRGTKLVDVSVAGQDPQFITQLVNTVVDVYVRLNLEKRLEETSGGAQWLRDEVAKMEGKMKGSQLSLQKFLEEHGTIDFGEEQQNTVLQRLQALNAEITETRKDRIEVEARYREKHPKLLELQAKERDLQLALQDQEQKALEMSRLSIQHNGLLRDVKTNEGIYNTLLTRLKELNVQEGLRTNNIQVVSHAKIPRSPIAPARGRWISVTTFLGILLGSVLAFAREIVSKAIRSRREFERVLEIPFLGHIPFVEMARGGKDRPVLLRDSQSSAAEAIRSIRTTLEFLLPSDQSHILLVTSALPEEGKSFFSLNLAIGLQELGRKVLLIDGDLRRPSLHKAIGVELEPGLSGLLAQESLSSQQGVQYASSINQLPVIPAGQIPSHPTDLLGSPRLRNFLQSLKGQYQYILIDAPPVLVAADASVLATLVDGVIFMVRAGRTHAEAALTGRQRLKDVGAKLIGGVLNAARLDLERGYQYYYYYSQAGKRYRRENPAGAKTIPAGGEAKA